MQLAILAVDGAPLRTGLDLRLQRLEAIGQLVQFGAAGIAGGVDVADEKLRTRAQQMLPRLRAAFVQSVQVYAAGLNTGSLPNADFIAKELQRETDRVLGQKGARLLLGTMLIN